MRRRRVSFGRTARILGASALIGSGLARAQHTNRVTQGRTNSVAEARGRPKIPSIDFCYCSHEHKSFNFRQYYSILEEARKEGKPYNTMLLELTNLTHAERALIERTTDKNADALVVLAKKIVANMRAGNNPEENKRLFQEFEKMCPLRNNFMLDIVLAAYANDVRRIRIIESYSEREIDNALKKNNGKDFPVKEYIKELARYIKFRNERMAETIYRLRKESESDPYYFSAPMRSMVILGAGHGGFNLEQGVHHEFAKRVKTTGGSTDLGVIKTFTSELKPRNIQELIGNEAIRLAQKTPAEIEGYELSPSMKQIEKRMLETLRMQKK